MPKLGMKPIRRAQVIRAVIELIADEGLEALTVDGVAKKAGVSKGVVNYYFSGKHDLLQQSFQAFLESYYQQIADLIQADMTALEMLTVVIDVCFPDGDVALQLWQHDPKLKHKVLPEENSEFTYPIEKLGKVFIHFLSRTVLDKTFETVHQTVYRTYLEGTKAIMEHGIDTNEFRQVDAEKAAFGLMALIEGLVLYRNIGFNPMSAKEYRSLCRDYIKDQLDLNHTNKKPDR
jgi:TetR/AcrR family transcriptional repressor of bet genes